MTRVPRHLSRLALASAVLLLAGIVPAGATPHSPTTDPRVEAAPVGVWSGAVGNPFVDDDMQFVVILPGEAGSQQAFYYWHGAGGGCHRKGGMVIGDASLVDADTVAIVGDYVCVETGAVLFADVKWQFAFDRDADTLTGGPGGPDVMTRKCNGANWTQKGTKGDDVLIGTSGHDVIEGRGGNDTIKGLGGVDILCGQDGKDTLIGGGDEDFLFGGLGADRLKGGSGFDVMFGGAGKDKLFGEAGNDYLFGDSEPDVLDGGPGKDRADGGSGADTCTAEKLISC